MRILPILTAIIVTTFLYFLVIDRETLLEFARGGAGNAHNPAPDATTPTTTAETAPEDDQDSRISVVAVHSKATVIDSAVILRGQTEAARQVQVRAETSGLVISDPLRKGSMVEKGDLLCRLDPGTRASALAEAQARLAEARARVPEAKVGIPRAEAQLEQALAQLEEARINDNAARKLSRGGFASDTRVASAAAAVRGAEAAIKSAEASVKSAQSAVLSVQAGIQSAQAGVAAAEKEIDRLALTAPFGGILESDTAELGALLSPGATCATVIQLDPVKIVGFVPETEVNRVALGAPAGARLTTGQRVTGQVTFLARSADPLTRTFRVEVEVPNPDLAIRDGQTAEVAIASDGAHAHLLPQSALTLNDDGLLGVRVVDNAQQARFTAVTLLRDTPQGVWLAGLPETADVIIIGQEYVIDGVAVRATFPGTDPQEPEQ
ncbi:MAG: efflux transporter periplasmic adaptor subunit [Rhodobacterales bacterium]|nr:MAG: efflux transporter periplasmic adaptor subunit [Rhodobacterales bacterium]